MKTYTLNIDIDAKCPKCGKPGSVNGGLCLDCAIADNDRRWREGDKIVYDLISKGRKHAAEVYAIAAVNGCDQVLFERMNESIIKRWGKPGLARIKSEFSPIWGDGCILVAVDILPLLGVQ